MMKSLMSGALAFMVLTVGAQAIAAQEQSRESMALDNTAAQWSLQFAYQANTDFRQDTLANGAAVRRGVPVHVP